MHFDPFDWTLPALMLGLLLGTLITYWRTKARTQQATAEQTERVRATEEQLRSATQEAERLRGNLETLDRERATLVATLEQVREQRAQLEVHAGRVPELQTHLDELGAEHRRLSDRLIQLSQMDGQKTREIADLNARLSGMNIEMTETRAARDAALAETRQQGEALAELKAENEAEQRQLADKTALLTVAQTELGQQQAEIATYRERNAELAGQLGAARETLEGLRAALERTTQQREAAAAEARQLAEKIAELTTSLTAEHTQTEEKMALLNAAKEQLKTQFENLANQIFEEKGQKFARQNQESLGLLLNPLQEKIKVFQEQVAQTYDKDSKERLTLKNEIERLAALNIRISDEAVNLTQALKGNTKTQGNWGEMVLERVLESSGLTKGREYTIQESFANDAGNHQRPDVVIYLPEGKHLVIDSKMSLPAYERYCSADTEQQRDTALRDHLLSMRAHIKSLSEKNYQSLHDLKSLDYVFMFIPVEPAFMLAATSDATLFDDAFNKNVLLVSPSTLLAMLRTVASIWRQEHQSRNAQLIADQCARLYDKFVGFVENLEDIGRRLEQAQKAYSDAHSKLTSGRGNLIQQAERVKTLGVKPSKSLPSGLLPGIDEAEQ